MKLQFAPVQLKAGNGVDFIVKKDRFAIDDFVVYDKAHRYSSAVSPRVGVA
jgi:hypothetical protein